MTSWALHFIPPKAPVRKRPIVSAERRLKRRRKLRRTEDKPANVIYLSYGCEQALSRGMSQWSDHLSYLSEETPSKRGSGESGSMRFSAKSRLPVICSACALSPCHQGILPALRRFASGPAVSPECRAQNALHPCDSGRGQRCGPN